MIVTFSRKVYLWQRIIFNTIFLSHQFSSVNIFDKLLTFLATWARYSRSWWNNIVVSEMILAIGWLQVDFSEKPVFWKALKPPLKDKCGELLVSLSYHPTNSTLTLIILKARNLKAKDINGKSGQDRKRKDVPQKKTKKNNQTNSATWSHHLLFSET